MVDESELKKELERLNRAGLVNDQEFLRLRRLLKKIPPARPAARSNRAAAPAPKQTDCPLCRRAGTVADDRCTHCGAQFRPDGARD